MSTMSNKQNCDSNISNVAAAGLGLGMSRRTFAKGMAVAAAALATSGVIGVVSRTQAAQAATTQAADDQTWNVDVLVIGAGAAGLTAAEAASENDDLKVMLIEKEAWMAGSSSLAQGGIYGAGTQIQKDAGVDDTPEAFLEYLLSRGGDKLDYDLQQWCSVHFGETIDWMNQTLGIPFDAEVAKRSVDTVPRRHQVTSTSQDACDIIYDKCIANGVDIRFSTAANALILDDSGAVVGVSATTTDSDGNEAAVTINAQKVIIASGGFCRNADMIDKYCPDFSGVYTEVGIGCTGEGLQMGLDVGAAYMGHGGTNGILACPVEPGQSKLIATDVMWVASDGRRFVNEAGQTHDIYYQVAGFDDQKFYAVYDQAKVDGLNDILKTKFDLALEMGYATQGDTVAEAAKAMGLDGDTVEQSLTDYNQMCQTGEDTEFGKKAEKLVELATAPYYLIEMGVCTHGSFGGYNVNTNIEVLDENGDAIQNLYGAGEVSSGSFIYDDYPGGGCGLAWCFTSGRWAGINAAAGIETPVADPTDNANLAETTEQMKSERETPLAATQDMTFNPHNERHGEIPCATCHDAEPQQTVFCTTCHNNAEVPEGWTAAEMPGREDEVTAASIANAALSVVDAAA